MLSGFAAITTRLAVLSPKVFEKYCWTAQGFKPPPADARCCKAGQAGWLQAVKKSWIYLVELRVRG